MRSSGHIIIALQNTNSRKYLHPCYFAMKVLVIVSVMILCMDVYFFYNFKRMFEKVQLKQNMITVMTVLQF